MFGFGQRNRGGLLGSLFGGRNYSRYQQPRRGGLVGLATSPLGQMALMAGATWLGNRVMQRRNQPNVSQGNEIGNGGSGWGASQGSANQFENNPNGQSW